MTRALLDQGQQDQAKIARAEHSATATATRAAAATSATLAPAAEGIAVRSKLAVHPRAVSMATMPAAMAPVTRTVFLNKINTIFEHEHVCYP
jgi:hypothetical protein